jgi:hypothetical protein
LEERSVSTGDFKAEDDRSQCEDRREQTASDGRFGQSGSPTAFQTVEPGVFA